MLRGTRQRDLLKQPEQRDFFKLFVFLSFLAKSRAIAPFYHACMYARARAAFAFALVHLSHCCCIIETHFRSPLNYVARYTLASYRRKGAARFVSMKKCAIFFLSKEEVSILAPRHFYPAYFKLLSYASPYLRIISRPDERDIISAEEEML